MINNIMPFLLSKRIVLWVVVTIVFLVVNVYETQNHMNASISKFGYTIDRQEYYGDSPSSDCSRLTPSSLKKKQEDTDQVDEGGILLYPQNPHRFNALMLECLENPKCHFLYHHVPKTAGSYIASSLYPIFENGRPYISSDWCCFEIIMDKFWNDTEKYCVQQKMGVLEVRGNEYAQALETCETQYSSEGHTYLGLVTTRDPIQRTLSLIHQQCNTGYKSKNPHYQSLCRNCTYDRKSASFWQRFIDDTNMAYRTVDDYLKLRKNSTNTHNSLGRAPSKKQNKSHRLPILVIDNTMVNDLFEKLDVGLKERNRPSIDRGVQNQEDLSICNFGMTSRMFKLLRPASSVFLDLWSGYEESISLI